MMIFRITGADSKTGEDRTILVRSDDERKAIAAAKSKGVHPYQVQRDSTAEKAESERQQAAHAAAEVQRRTASVIEAMRQRIKRGKSVFLYESVYVPVDSLLLDEHLNWNFDITAIRSLGILGWEVVQSVPRTVGIGLKNADGVILPVSSWGGGSGGNVAGVHIILKKEISLDELEPTPTNEVLRFVEHNLDHLAPPVTNESIPFVEENSP